MEDTASWVRRLYIPKSVGQGYRRFIGSPRMYYPKGEYSKFNVSDPADWWYGTHKLGVCRLVRTVSTNSWVTTTYSPSRIEEIMSDTSWLISSSNGIVPAITGSSTSIFQFEIRNAATLTTCQGKTLDNNYSLWRAHLLRSDRW